MSEWKKAQVKHYDSNKGFGFLDGEKGRIFFHVSGYCQPKVIVSKGVPVVTGDKETMDQRIPRLNEWIVYLPGHNDHGDTADRWCYLDLFADKEREARAMLQYRLVRRWRSQETIANPAHRKWVTQYTIHENVVWTGYSIHLWQLTKLLREQGNRLATDSQLRVEQREQDSEEWAAVTSLEVDLPDTYFTTQDLFLYPLGIQQPATAQQ
jgi:hypothetical protein